jgi:hypothetical protein
MSKTATVERLKSLRLHGMVAAWTDLIAQGESSIASSTWLIDHLLEAEETDRAMRSIRHQLAAAKLPIHRDLTGFDFSAAKVDEDLVTRLATLAFTDTADNVVLVGGAGHRENPSGDCPGPPRHRSTGTTGSVLLNGRSGQHPGKGKARWALGTAGRIVAADGSRHSG